jgi:hypothetical protein
VPDDDAPPATPAPEAVYSPEDLAKLFMISGMPSPELPQSRSALRKKLLIAVLIGGVGVGASVMSCVGQSFSYRQAHALEGIEQQLKELRASCTATAVERP